MNRSLAQADFARAASVVGAESDLRALTGRLGIDWDLLEWLALGVAEEVHLNLVSPLPQDKGADAFVAGFLVGVFLAEPSHSRRELGSGLPRAVDEAQARGRHAVIAERCDPQGVGALEVVYRQALAQPLDLPADDSGVLDPAVRLLESGLAAGLALADAAPA